MCSGGYLPFPTSINVPASPVPYYKEILYRLTRIVIRLPSFFTERSADRPNRGLRLRMNTAEAFEIMLSDKISCCRIHPVYIML